MMNFEEIKRYWEERAAGDSSAQSTTQDFYLREIEFNVLLDHIRMYVPENVVDVGCGDGRTTSRLSQNFPDISFIGYDYSHSMIENAKKVVLEKAFTNINFEQLDICDGMKRSSDLIYTTRCLINLPSWDLQKNALSNIHKALSVGGHYLMVENFMEGQDNFNQVRKSFGLSEIAVREHNLFFKRQQLLDFFNGIFIVEKEINISSTYYLTSRVIYSKMCAETGKQPDYFDDHHRFAAGVP